MTEIAEAHVLGQPDHLTRGHPSGLAASAGENWMVPCDRGGRDFDDWWDSTTETDGLPIDSPTLRRLAERAWEASRQRHTAGLRRVGWLDQKGRVWTEIPSGAEYNGGSYTPLLIDARD